MTPEVEMRIDDTSYDTNGSNEGDRCNGYKDKNRASTLQLALTLQSKRQAQNYYTRRTCATEIATLVHQLQGEAEHQAVLQSCSGSAPGS